MLYGGSPYGALELGGVLLGLASGVTIKKTTNGVITDITSAVLWQSLEVTSVLTKEVGTCKFSIYSIPGLSLPVIGDQIDVYELGTHVFGGTVTESKIATPGGILLQYDISCMDWSFKLNGKLVIKSYAAQDPGDVVKDIISTFAAAGFTTYNVQNAGVNLTSIKFNYEQISSAIEKLAKQVGFEWFVDADKDIHFFPPGAVVNAPYPIDDTSGNLQWATLEVDQSIVNMKNSVFVIGGTYSKVLDAGSTPDIYATDGTKLVFPIAYPYTSATIVVLLDSTPQSVGIDQLTDPGTVQVLYNEQNRFIRFTSVPADGHTVTIYGTAQIPILAHVQNQSAITAYGEIQDSIVDPQINSIAEAQERGMAEISSYGSPVYGVKFSTLKLGFVVGQTVSVDSAIFGTNVMVEIKRITRTLYSPTQFLYSIECVGTERVSFIDVMKLLLSQANAQTVIGDSTVLQVLKSFEEIAAASDSVPAPTTSSPPYLWGSFTWGLGAWSP